MKYAYLCSLDTTRFTATSIVLCLASIILPLAVMSQTGTFAGLDLRVHSVSHSGGFRSFASDVGALFEDGTGFGQSIGLKLGYRSSGSFGISTTVAYNNLPGKFEIRTQHSHGSDFQLEFITDSPGDTSNPSDASFAVNTDVRYATLSLEALGEWRPFVKNSTWSIGIAAGPTLDYVVTGEMKQTISVLTPANAYLANPNDRPVENGGRRIVLYDDEILGARSLLLGIRAGVTAEFGNLNSGVIVSPGIFYHHGLTNVTEAENWSLNRLTGQVTVMIGL